MANMFDYTEVVIETCTGDINNIVFDDGPLRANKRRARQVALTLSTIALSGKPMSHYQESLAADDWFQEFPDESHLIRVIMRQRSYLTTKAKTFTESVYPCEHTAVRT